MTDPNETEARAHADGFNSGYTLALRDAGHLGRPPWPAEKARTDALGLALSLVNNTRSFEARIRDQDEIGPAADIVLDVAVRFLTFITEE